MNQRRWSLCGSQLLVATMLFPGLARADLIAFADTLNDYSSLVTHTARATADGSDFPGFVNVQARIANAWATCYTHVDVGARAALIDPFDGGSVSADNLYKAYCGYFGAQHCTQAAAAGYVSAGAGQWLDQDFDLTSTYENSGEGQY